MIKKILFMSVLAIGGVVNAQHLVSFHINSLPEFHPAGSSIYLAGSFNGWNPQDEKYKFTKEGNEYVLNISLQTGKYEYKLTRGSWDKVESAKSGQGIANRQLRVDDKATVNIQVEEWQDRFPAKPRASTASKNVRIIDTAFWIPQLKRTRRVWIYLPDDYLTSNKKYPVLYMHDGQNIFDDATSFSGEWGIDEFMDSTSLSKSIIVGIDHGSQKRLNEYNPYDNARFGTGEGNAYLDFLVKNLKPFIDKNYRTKKDKENTFIAGSSMGGLISMSALLRYPKTFGSAGVFSPAFWTAPKIFDDIRSKGKKVKSRIYFYAGKKEGETMVPDMMKAFEEMAKVSKSVMTTVIRDEGTHNEATWRKEFPAAYKFFVE